MNGDLQLDLTPGEWVEVRSEQEILATLDEQGTLDNVPFMPEMLAHCGRRFQVYKRADKTCDTVTWTSIRRMERTVHLTLQRCNGSAHGGCQAGCLIFWKEAWLKRWPGGEAEAKAVPASTANTTRDRAWLEATVLQNNTPGNEVRYRCQATQLVQFSTVLPWWEPKQYVRDVCMNKVPMWQVLRSVAYAAFSKGLRFVTGRSFPNVKGKLKKTPSETLGIQAGDWVTTKSKAEILATLDTKGRNRGMTFDAEMLPYCGNTYRVLRRVERLIEETTGRLIEPPGVSLILDNVVCTARFRRLCPRSVYPYWREIWLRRATPEEIAKVGGNADSATMPVEADGVDLPCGQ